MASNERMKMLIEGCENEKLHLSGHIQPFGALIATDFNCVITHASQNLSEFYPHSAKYVLGRNLQEVDEQLFLSLKKLSGKAGNSHTFLGVVKFGEKRLDAFMSTSPVGFVIEIESNSSEFCEPVSLHQMQLKLLTVPSEANEVDEYSSFLVEAVKKVCDFDRVMIYKFHDDWSGEVVAEATNDGVGSYFGLRFPASDIPQIARNIYLLNPFRLIPDINASPVMVHSLQKDVLDLTYSDLRSVSPVHLEYLSHMGVGASFSVPIRINNTLWGLVACHNITPKYLPLEHRQYCASLTQSYSIGISAYSSSRRLRVMDMVDHRISHILEELASSEHLMSSIQINSLALMDLMSAHGIVLVTHDDAIMAGRTPDALQIKKFDKWFVHEYEEILYSSDNISSTHSEFESFDNNVAGVMAVKVKSIKAGWVRFYWFRQEEISEVMWAGNPDKPGAEDPDATALSPRRSFEKWTEIKHGFSRPWNNEDNMVGLKFRNTLFRWI